MAISVPHCSIDLHGLELSVYLGWPEAERLQKQIVLLDIHIQFQLPLKACQTDDIADTYCYDSITRSITEKITAQRFRLIEYLGFAVYQHTKQLLPNTDIAIRIKKQPAILNLTGGVSFSYGDISHTW